MHDFADDIRTTLNEIKQAQRLDRKDVSYLITQARQLLESKQWQTQYPYLNFYCNWTLHPELQKSQVAQRILDRISDEFSSQEPKSYNDIILEIIGLPHLRKDLVHVCTAVAIPTFLFESKSTWKAFVSVLVGLLIDKPIARRSDEEIAALRAKGPHYVIKLRLQGDNESTFWIAEISKPDVVVKGLFGLSEPDSAFRQA